MRRETRAKQQGGLGPSQNDRTSIPDIPNGTNLSFHMSRTTEGKIETLPILPIYPRPSQTIWDIYDFEFSLVSKFCDGQGALKSPIVWTFPTYENPAYDCFFFLLFVCVSLSSERDWSGRILIGWTTENAWISLKR